MLSITGKVRLALEALRNPITRFSIGFDKKKLIIFIGKVGIKAVAYAAGRVEGEIFSNYKDDPGSVSCLAFLNSYKNFQVLVLLDSTECQLKHEFIPIIQSVLKLNPVEKFIGENYNSEEITAYNVSRIENAGGEEVWETTIASSPYAGETRVLLEFIMHNSFRLVGTHLLSLELEPIIDVLLKKSDIADCQNDLQIFTTITRSSGIRIAAKYRKNILDESTVEFPFEKSESYIAGTIEQALTDKILKYKGYAKSLELSVCLIFLCDEGLIDILRQTPSLKQYKIISGNNISKLQPDKSNSHFQDSKLLELVWQRRKYLAANKLLKSVTRLTVINSLIFKPLLVVIALIAVVLGRLGYESFIIQEETAKLNDKYYVISEKYRNVKKQHPAVENIPGLTDLYSLQQIIDVKSPVPFGLLESILAIGRPDIEFNSVIWHMEDASSFNKKILLTINLLYTSDKKDKTLVSKTLDDYATEIEKLLKGSSTRYEIEYDKAIELSRKLIIPVKVIISTGIREAGNGR